MYNVNLVSTEEYLRLNYATKYDDPTIFSPLIPEGWRVLNSSSDTDDYLGYYGRAYINGDKIVISNRGSIDINDPLQYPDSFNRNYNILADYALNNVQGVYLFRGPWQISSAEMFYLSINQTYGAQYDVSLTGFSLGGLLSSVLSYKYHLTSIVFDTPGDVEILRNLDINVTPLANITIILSAPNIVNTHGTHSRAPYYLDVSYNMEQLSVTNFIFDTPTVHNMNTMLAAIPYGVKQTTCWPTIKTAYNNFVISHNFTLVNKWNKLFTDSITMEKSVIFCAHFTKIKQNLNEISCEIKESYYTASEYCDEFAEFIDQVAIESIYTQVAREFIDQVAISVNERLDSLTDMMYDLKKSIWNLIGVNDNTE